MLEETKGQRTLQTKGRGISSVSQNFKLQTKPFETERNQVWLWLHWKQHFVVMMFHLCCGVHDRNCCNLHSWCLHATPETWNPEVRTRKTSLHCWWSWYLSHGYNIPTLEMSLQVSSACAMQWFCPEVLPPVNSLMRGERRKLRTWVCREKCGARGRGSESGWARWVSHCYIHAFICIPNIPHEIQRILIWNEDLTRKITT
jgi:hypothetical protein